jgi:hypothetical protein
MKLKMQYLQYPKPFPFPKISLSKDKKAVEIVGPFIILPGFPLLLTVKSQKGF